MFFLAIVIKVNMQIEGFIFQLFSLFFGGAFIHYALAKLFGPLYFGRGFCGWACWNAMVFDLLPWKKSKGRISNLGIIRYLHLVIVIIAVTILFFKFNYSVKTGTVFSLYWFLAGNVIYFTTGILLAAIVSDNRSFCKYICPIPPIQKVFSRFSVLKVRIDPRKCTECHVCEKNCPMDIKILEYKNDKTRVKSTECIMCNACSDICPTGAIFISSGFDTCTKEHLNVRNTMEDKQK
jgi:polyferredoxin